MRFSIVVAFGGLAFAACSTDNGASPSLTISPTGSGGPLQISAPTNFTASVVNSSDDITWSITAGSGTLSGSSGPNTVFTPPTGTGTETLTATSGSLTASVTISSTPLTLSAEQIPGLSAPVTVQYDAQDIPHIQCAAANDCYAVQGYVQARDRLFPMDFLRHVARSHLGELIGPAGLSQDVELRTLFITRAGNRLEDDLTASLDPQTAAIFTSFNSGVNAFLAQLRATQGRLPGEYAQLPFTLTPFDIDDWTTQDSVAMARLFQFELSESLDEETEYGQLAAVWGPGGKHEDLTKLNAYVRAAAPPTEQAHTLETTPFQPSVAAVTTAAAPHGMSGYEKALADVHASFQLLKAQLAPIKAPFGSNNWVISAAKSATGQAMVANDPHLGLQYPPLFHLVTMTSSNAADNLDLAGGAFPGIPGALVGRGAHVGWGVTVVGYDVTDLYLEQFEPCSAGGPVACTNFNNTPTPVKSVAETFNVRIGEGSAGIVTTTQAGIPGIPSSVVIVPAHGPIISAPDATGKAVSVRWTGQEGNTHDLRAFLGLDTATDVDGAITALKDYATGAQNFVLADDAGHIAYDPHALVPVRPWASTFFPWFPVPGNGSAEWGNGSDNCASATLTPVPATCWIADDVLPQGKDPAKGYFFTANSDPTAQGVSDDNNPLNDGVPYFSFDWDDSSGFRATRIEQRIEATLGSGSGTVALADMESIQADHVSRIGKVFTDIIGGLPDAGSASPDLTAARAVLSQWATNGWDCPSGLIGSDPVNSGSDATPEVVQNSAGCFLFHAFIRQLVANVFTDDLAVAGQGVDGLPAIKALIFMLDAEIATSSTAQSSFCNDVDGTGTVVATHSCVDQVETALVTAYDELTGSLGTTDNWTWGRHHTIQPVSQLALVTTDYEPGPYARPGGLFTVDVGNPSLSDHGIDFPYTSGGNVRHISVMDPAAPIVEMQLPGPERDGPDTIIGPDLLGQWVLNEYFAFAFSGQIGSAAVSTQSFTAQ